MFRDLKFSDLSHVERASVVLALRDWAERREANAAELEAHQSASFADSEREEAARARAILAKVER